MNKLTIEEASQINPHWYALRFSGATMAFRAMTQLLGRQRDYNVYWQPSAFDGKGAWIVRAAWFEQYRSRFHNLDRALTAARREAAIEGMKEGMKERG
jgi:hypothetical protein